MLQRKYSCLLTRHNKSICIQVDRFSILEPVDIRRWKASDLTGQGDEVIYHHSQILRVNANNSWRNYRKIRLYTSDCILRHVPKLFSIMTCLKKFHFISHSGLCGYDGDGLAVLYPRTSMMHIT